MVSRKNLVKEPGGEYDGDDDYGDAGGDLVKEPDHHCDEDDLVACSPLNASEEKGHKRSNLMSMMMIIIMMMMMFWHATAHLSMPARRKATRRIYDM